MANEELPPWMTKELIKSALQDGKQSPEVIIEHWEVNSAVPKGNNYSGIVLRANVEYRRNNEEKRNVSLILKAMNIPCFAKEAKLLGVTQKEHTILREYLPKVYELFGDYLGPKVYFSSEEEVLIMDDLKSEGYEMADRRKQLDFDHCVVALTSIAKFHAASVKIHETDPDLIESVSKEVMLSDLEFSKGFTDSFYKTATKEMKLWPECQDYSENIDKIGENLFSKLKSIVTAKPETFNVLNHGDCWTTNMMFKYENDKVVHAKLIDFQVCRYATPALDLIHFFTVSAQDSARIDRFEELIDIYLDVLNKHLELAGLRERLTKDELQKSLDDSLLFGFYIFAIGLPIILADPDKIADFSTSNTVEELFSEDSSPFLANYRSDTHRILCSKRLREYENKGLIMKNA